MPSTRTPQPGDPLEPLLAKLETMMAADKVPGIAFMFDIGNGPETYALGRRQAGSCEPFTTKTRIRLGRPTRTLVSIAVLIAEAEGKLALTDTVSSHISGFHVTNGNADLVTIETLLDHSAGLYVADFMKTCPSQDIVGYWSSVDARLEHEPGAAVSNFDEELSLLGAIVAQVYQKPFRDVIRDKIFTPLGMTATYDHDEFLLGEHALGGPQLQDPAPCGAWEPVRQVYASLEDLIPLASYLSGTPNAGIPIADVSRIRDMGKPHHEVEFSTGYGMESLKYDAQGHVLYTSDGDTGTYGAELDLIDGKRIAFVENGGGATWKYGDAIIKATAGLEVVGTWLHPLPKSRWAEYEGTWRDSTSVPSRDLTIEFDGTDLRASFNGLPAELTAFGEDTFELTFFGLFERLRFWRNDANAPYLLTPQFGNTGPAFVKVP